MSKEATAGPLRFLRFPVADKQLMELTGATDRAALKDLKEVLRIDAETGHRLPRPRRNKGRRGERSRNDRS